ncbi:MAG: coiled-coil domain-containing protein, partial [Eubacterium sp.]
MKQHGFATRLLAVLLAFCFFTASFSGIITSYAADSSVDDEYAGMTAEEKQALIEQKLKEVNEKLDSLGEQSKETEEYINTLDEKIRYLKNQLSMSEEEINTSQQKIKDLKQQYKDNEEQIAQMEIDIAELSQQTEKLQQEFDENLELYNQRLRAMYVSGNTSVLAMLLTSPDISTLFTRFEMVKRVSASDRQLLESVKT